MKLITTTFFTIIFISSLFGQTPYAFNYQAVARDLSGSPITNQTIGVRMTILTGSATGTEVFQETHSLTTTELGLFNLQIGNGTIINGTIADIDWGNDAHFLQIEIDETGGSNYQLIGTSQFMSVPYAEYANNASKWEEVEINNRILYPNKVNIGLLNNNDPFDYNLNINDSVAGTSGLSILNSNSNGRSIFLAGESNLQQYIYMAYNNSNWNPINSAFKPQSGVIFSGGSNGINHISSNGDINFVTGGLQIPFTRLTIKLDGNIGIGTVSPGAKLQVADGDIYIEDVTKGVIMKSPNGQCWRYTPDNSGQLIPTAITCPN